MRQGVTDKNPECECAMHALVSPGPSVHKAVLLTYAVPYPRVSSAGPWGLPSLGMPVVICPFLKVGSSSPSWQTGFAPS